MERTISCLSTPGPEILPEEVYAVRPDAIVATGRSDYPNQVNNVLGFPYIFRGALDVGATTINEAMVEACVHALAELATEEAPDTVLAAYGDNDLKFGRDYLIPKPLDPRLITKLAPAVAQAAMDSGVATRPLQDVETYRHSLSRYVYATILVMRPLFERARRNPKRLIYADGEHPQVLRAVQAVVDEGMAEPMVIGNPERVAAQLQHIGLRIRPGKEVQIIDPAARAGSDEQAEAGHTLNTLVGARLLAAGEAGGLICGLSGNFRRHLAQVQRTLGTRGGIRQAVAMDVVVLKRGAYFFCDTGVREHPDSHDLAEIMLLAAAGVRRFGITPRLAVLSSANPPWHEGQETEDKLRAAVSLVRRQQPELQVEGPMRAETALSEPLRRQLFPDSNLQGEANLFVLPDLVAARIACDLVKMLGDGVAIGPILLGLDHPVHILAASSTVRRIVNATAIAVVDAQAIEAELPDQTLA